MSERHITDEEIHEAAGAAPRDVPGMPKATCLRCLNEHVPYYASMAHECVVDLAVRKSYGEWLLLFQKWGMGVLRTPDDRKFPAFNRVISGRSMLTQHLQSDIFAGPGYELQDDYYCSPQWVAAGLVVLKL